MADYPKEVQETIAMARVMTRDDIIKYYEDKIKYYEEYSQTRLGSWAKEYPRNYRNKLNEILKDYDKNGIACWLVDYNHYGHGFDCEDIDVYLHTDGTYSVSHHTYSAY